MSLNDPFANALSSIMNSERIGKRKCAIYPMSNLIRQTLKILHHEKYVGELVEHKDSKGEWGELNLISAINKCGVIKPRHAVSMDNYQKFEKRFLPASNFGILIISTSKGLMTHTEAKEKKLGGRLLAYCY